MIKWKCEIIRKLIERNFEDDRSRKLQINMKIVELFSGIGAQTQALKNLKIPHTAIACEYEGYIHNIYEAIHGLTQNLGDITKITSLPDCDILTYSFPCQDLSILGNQKGLVQGSGTRSALLWEVGRLLVGNKPKVLILENVKQLVSPKHIESFKLWIEFLNELGYETTYKLINSADFGIPQNRIRCFAVSMLGKKFKFSDYTPRISKMSDVMQSNTEVLNEFGDIHFAYNIDMLERLWKTVNNTQSTNSTNRIYGTSNMVHALTTQGSHPGNFGAVLYNSSYDTEYYLRKETKGKPKEELIPYLKDTRLATTRDYFRLMGFDDGSYERAKKCCKTSYTKLYHVSGNSIVVPVLEYIFSDVIKQLI